MPTSLPESPTRTTDRAAAPRPDGRRTKRDTKRERRRFPVDGGPPGGVGRMVYRAARVAARWPKTVILVWVVLIAGCVAGGAATGTKSITHEGGKAESALADARIDAAGLGGPDGNRILVRSASPDTTDAVAADLEARLHALPAIARIKSPLPGGGNTAALRTADGRGVLLDLSLVDMPNGPPAGAPDPGVQVTRAIQAVHSAHPEATILQDPDGAVSDAMDDVVSQDLQRAETLSVPITLLVLVLAFGAIVAASVPLVLGITAVAGAMGALGAISQLVPASDSTGSLVVLIGLAVGVDYSLFYVRREREERRKGLRQGAALAAASASVGRAILVSGVTVMVALAGLILTGNATFTSMGVGTITVVAIALVGSLTVLPAMLTLLGDRVEAGRLGLPGARRRRLTRERAAARAPRRSAWGAIASRVTGAPKTSLVAALLVLAALAYPAASMKLGQGGSASMPKGVPAIDAEVAIEKAFPGSADSADFVVRGTHLDSAAARAGLQTLGARALRVTHGAGDIPVSISKDARTAVVRVPLPDVNPTASQATIKRLRAQVSPLTPSLVPGAGSVGITGDAAGGLDFANQVKSVMPLVGGFVLGLAFILLLLSFRSWQLALAVIGLNLMSVAAAYGVMVAVFQNTWAESLLGFTSNGTITTWLPLLAFVILFGLSMDYSILVLERIREARHAGRSPRDAATEGVAATASTVTSAAIVMVFVFAIFATLRMLEMKQLGVGLAAAILVDATIVRAFALPAAVTLLGERAFPVNATFRAAAGTWDDARMAQPAHLATADVDA